MVAPGVGNTINSVPATTPIRTINATKRYLPPSIAIREFAPRIRNHPRSTAAEFVALGQLLIRVRGLLPAGQFENWFLELKASYSLRTAERAVTAARRLAKSRLPLAKFSASAVDILTRRAVIRSPRLIDALEVTAAQTRGLVTFSGAREAISAVLPTAIYGEPEGLTESEKLHDRLRDLLFDAGTTSLHLTADKEDGCQTITVMVLGENRRTVTRRNLFEAFAAAVGQEKMRICRRCDPLGMNPLPVTQFSLGAHYCKKCERKRVKAHTERKKKKPPGAEGPVAA